MKMRRRFFLLMVFQQILSLGCATATGPLFREVPVGEYKSKAIVYFYRHSTAGSATTFDLTITGENTLSLPNKGYHLLILNPGRYNFAVSYQSTLIAEESFDLQKDEMYYIRFRGDKVGYDPALFGSVPRSKYGIASVQREEALEVLKKCRLIEVPRKP